MKLYRQVEIYILWEKAKRSLWLPFLIAFLALIWFLLVSSSTSPFSQLIRKLIHDPVVSALAGAILGGVIGFYGSVYVQKAQAKSEATIHRRDEIYVPLYNELSLVRKTLHDNPCPDQFVYEINQDPHYWPKLAIWPSFKCDNRHLQVPKQLENSLDEFIAITEKYTTARREACRDTQVETKIKEIFVRNFGVGYSARSDLTWWLLPCSSDLTVLVKSLNFHVNPLKKDDKSVKTYSGEYFLKVAQEIIRECGEIDIVVRHQNLRIELNEKLEELITSLEKVIRFINERYEQCERWF